MSGWTGSSDTWPVYLRSLSSLTTVNPLETAGRGKILHLFADSMGMLQMTVWLQYTSGSKLRFRLQDFTVSTSIAWCTVFRWMRVEFHVCLRSWWTRVLWIAVNRALARIFPSSSNFKIFFLFLFIFFKSYRNSFGNSYTKCSVLDIKFHFTCGELKLHEKIFKYFSWIFSHVEKVALLERSGWFQNLWRHNLINKQLQDTYCPISHEVKTTRQWNLVR